MASAFAAPHAPKAAPILVQKVENQQQKATIGGGTSDLCKDLMPLRLCHLINSHAIDFQKDASILKIKKSSCAK
eukprot:4629012-Amphidinium_carterae.1